MTEPGFRIVDDLPMPEEHARAKYPFSDMDVGQCCVFEIEPDDTDEIYDTLKSMGWIKVVSAVLIAVISAHTAIA